MRRDAGTVHKGMGHIDIELKRYGKPIFQQPCGNEHTLGVARVNVAMTDGAVRKSRIKMLRNQRLIAFSDGERNKIKGFAVERRRDCAWNGLKHALQFIGG